MHIWQKPYQEKKQVNNWDKKCKKKELIKYKQYKHLKYCLLDELRKICHTTEYDGLRPIISIL